MKEAMTKIIESSKPVISGLNVEQLCIMVKAQMVADGPCDPEFNKLACDIICDRKTLRSPQELIQLLQTHFRYFSKFLPLSKVGGFRNLILGETQRFMESHLSGASMMKPHEYAMILHFLQKQYPSSPQTTLYFERMVEFDHQLFQLEALIFVIQSITDRGNTLVDLKPCIIHAMKGIENMIERISNHSGKNDEIHSQSQFITLLSSLSNYA